MANVLIFYFFPNFRCCYFRVDGLRGKVGLRVASETGGEEESFFGKMKDGGTITVADQATCDLIKSAKDYNSNVTITVG